MNSVSSGDGVRCGMTAMFAGVRAPTRHLDRISTTAVGADGESHSTTWFFTGMAWRSRRVAGLMWSAGAPMPFVVSSELFHADFLISEQGERACSSTTPPDALQPGGPRRMRASASSMVSACTKSHVTPAAS